MEGDFTRGELRLKIEMPEFRLRLEIVPQLQFSDPDAQKYLKVNFSSFQSFSCHATELNLSNDEMSCVASRRRRSHRRRSRRRRRRRRRRRHVVTTLRGPSSSSRR